MAELKPCPFCGGKYVYESFMQEHLYSEKIPVIYCNTCGAKFSVEITNPFLNMEEAYKYHKRKVKEVWNRRYDPKVDERTRAYWENTQDATSYYTK